MEDSEYRVYLTPDLEKYREYHDMAGSRYLVDENRTLHIFIEDDLVRSYNADAWTHIKKLTLEEIRKREERAIRYQEMEKVYKEKAS